MKNLERDYGHVLLNEEQVKNAELIRKKSKELAELIEEVCPNGREKSLAHTNLEQAGMWANAGIIRG